MHMFRPVGFYLILHKYTEGSGAHGPFPLYYQGLHNVSPPKWLKNSVEITEGWIKLQSVLK